MPPELQAEVDRLTEEFMATVDALTQERHLQKGIARSQLPCSMVAVLDRERLSVLAQLRSENRCAGYYHNLSIALTPQQAANNAQWEFGFEDPFIIQFPKDLLDWETEQRRQALEKVASEHIESEFNRFAGLLNLMRTRPIFGLASLVVGARSALLLMPKDESFRGNLGAIMKAIDAGGLLADEAGDIRNGKAAVHEMWISINQVAVIIADLTGADAGVMYALGIAHTIGKETVLIYPQGGRYLTDIPRTHRIEYTDSDAGRADLEEQLFEMLGTILQPIAED